MHHAHSQITILFAHDLLSLSGYLMVTHTYPIAGNSLWLLGDCKQTHKHLHTSHPQHTLVVGWSCGPADFYSGQLPGKQRKGILLEELLAGGESRRYHKKKYLELQNKFMSGTKRLRNIKHKKKFKTIS